MQCLGSSTGEPLPEGAYNEPLRPQVHYTRVFYPLHILYKSTNGFAASENFSNDPNGLIYANNLYHVYHQWNAHENKPGYQNWGHATSEDLVHWKLHPPAITPDSEEGPFIFSGSAVIDVDNTSGVFNDTTAPENRMVALYTSATDEKQTQNLAYSTDGGYSYTKRPGPVIDLNNTQFRGK